MIKFEKKHIQKRFIKQLNDHFNTHYKGIIKIICWYDKNKIPITPLKLIENNLNKGFIIQNFQTLQQNNIVMINAITIDKELKKFLDNNNK